MTSSRRTFLVATAASAGAMVLPSCQIARPARPKKPLDQKLRLMVVGVAGRGGDNLAGVASEDITILCDVDRRHLEAAGKNFPNARLVADYRTILNDPAEVAKLDGVVVSTPDHTHYLPALLAMQHGLDVYCEKPLTQTVAQARSLLTTAIANGCVTQMGTQIHANHNYHRVVEAIQAGVVGTVREVIVFVNGTDWSAEKLPDTAPAPDYLAWDLWLGPTRLAAARRRTWRATSLTWRSGRSISMRRLRCKLMGPSPIRNVHPRACIANTRSRRVASARRSRCVGTPATTAPRRH